MKSAKSWILGILGLGVIALTIFWWQSYSLAIHKAGPKLIRFGEVTQRDFTEMIHFFGRGESTAAVNVTALEAGRIRTICVTDGAAIPAGKVLFTLDGPKLEPEMKAVLSSLKSARYRSDAAGKTVKQVRDAVNRHLMKQTELTAAIRDFAQGKKELATLESRWSELDAAAHLKAPIAGVFTARTVNPGENVRGGQRLARIVPKNRVRVAATLFPPEWARLTGAVAMVHRGDGTILKGTVVRVFPERISSGGVLIWIEGKEISAKLAPGSPVRGEIRFQHQPASAVPETAIARNETGQTVVFVRGKSGVEESAVKVGLIRGGWVEILSGLNPGEKIVTDGAYELCHRDFSHNFKVAD